MNRKPIAIALAQLNFKLCDFERNVARIRQAVQKAADADLIVFSELALSGYHPQDLVEEPDFLVRQAESLAAVREISREIAATLVIGAVTRNTGAGKPLHNSLLVMRQGEILLTYHKQLLPTYNIFDERRHFEPGESRAAILELKGWRVGFLICEDCWNDDGRDYAVNPLEPLAAAGVDLIVSINASPSDVGKERQRHDIFRAVARRRGIPIAYVNQVGANDQIVFDGGSFLVLPEAGIVHRLPRFAEAVEMVSFDGGFAVRGRHCDREVADDLSDSEFYRQQIVLGLRDYMEKVGFAGVVIGMSGGIDSALTAALACDALGAENVAAITMPSRFSSESSISDSAALCRNLGVKLYSHEIKALYESFTAAFQGSFGDTPSRLTRENVQARIRGAILMEYSNHFGSLVLSTGNKSEMSVGYATLYGDMNGGLNLIGDLYKTEVYALARHLNTRHRAERIPASILDKEPSAELSPGQKDSDSLPSYPVLDEILNLHIEGPRLRPVEYRRAKAFVDQLRTAGQGDVVDRVLAMVAKAEFKRRQAPPIIRLRGRAFGNGRQMPIAARYRFDQPDTVLNRLV